MRDTMTEVSNASLPGTPEERQALHDKARAIVLAVVETELGFTLDCNDSDPLTVADFLADVISGLERAQEREGGK